MIEESEPRGTRAEARRRTGEERVASRGAGGESPARRPLPSFDVGDGRTNTGFSEIVVFERWLVP